MKPFRVPLPIIVLAVFLAAVPTPSTAVNLTLSCLDVGSAVEACRASARRFEAASGHVVRVVAADASGRMALGRYQALFDIDSPRLDVLQFPDAWVPAMAPDLATLPEPGEGAAIPEVLDAARDAGRLVGWPHHMALTLLFLRSDLLPTDPSAWSELREALLVAPPDGTLGLAFGGAGPTLFVLFLDWVASFGPGGVEDGPQVRAALAALNDAIGTIAPPSVASTSPQEAVAAFTSGDAAALLARSTALPAVRSSPIAQDVAAVLRLRAAGAPSRTPLVVTTWFVGVSRHSSNGEAALDLARFLALKDEQRAAALDFGVPPASPSLYEEAAVAAIGPVFARIGRELGRLVPPPVARYGSAYLELSDEVAGAVRALLRGEAGEAETAALIERAVARAGRQGE
ncbi:extracellular solute-binding protein [Acuticoccus sp.]|uniref:extracellular solute-binding protein n=1 Tax=Acuticoccus sp. TaxID=1904378 RepID=UPI003B51684E